MMHDRVSAWLNHLGLGRYAESFQRKAITWDVLPELNEGDLETLGVLLGHRKHSCARSRNYPRALTCWARGLSPAPSVRTRHQFRPNEIKQNVAS